MDSADTSPYSFRLRDSIVSDNVLESKDSIIHFGEINYKHLTVTISNLNPQSNTLQLGSIFKFNGNCQMILLQCTSSSNQGQIASLDPASSDTNNPLVLTIDDNTFHRNFVYGDSLIQLSSNSKLIAKDSTFTENGSTGRGSILFADY
jgi:hypothetical protein